VIGNRRFVAGALALCWLLCLCAALTSEVNRDEHMYQAAAALLAHERLYADYAFLQPPYAVWIYAGVQELTPGDRVLLGARLFKALVAAGLLVALFRLLRRLASDPVLAALLVALLVHDSVVRGMVGLARNYDLAQLAILGALLLLPLRRTDPQGRLRLVLAGTLAGAAVGCKLTYAPLALAAVGWPLVAPACFVAGRRALAWTAIGCVAGLLPLGGACLGVDPAVLRFNLLDYHLLNGTWHVRAGAGEGLDLAGRVHDARRLYRDTDHAALAVLTLVAAALTGWRGRPRGDSGGRLGWLLVAAGVVMVAVPSPVQPAYYAPLLVGAAAVAASCAARLAGGARRALGMVAAAACLVAVAHHGAADLRLLRAAARPAAWPVARLHEAGEALAALTADRPDQPIATTHPLYALAAGRPLESAFATGEFAWRVGDLVDDEAQRRFRLVSPRTLPALIAERPPAAIVVEAAAPWDGPLVDAARARGWRRAALAPGVDAWLP